MNHLDAPARTCYNPGMSEEQAPDAAEAGKLTGQSLIKLDATTPEPAEEKRTKRKPSDAAHPRAQRSTKAPAQGGAPAPAPQQLTPTATPTATPTTTEAPTVPVLPPPVLTDSEAEIYSLIVIKRMSPQNAARRMNKLQNTDAWTTAGIGAALQSAREKVGRMGEVESQRSLSSVTQETRDRYDALLAGLHADLARMAAPEDETLPDVWLGMRAKVSKTIADIEAIRDASLQALAPAPGTLPGGGALLYVSRLRGPVPSA